MNMMMTGIARRVFKKAGKYFDKFKISEDCVSVKE